MPSPKPRLQTIVEPEIYEKVKYLCEKEDRSESQIVKVMIKKYLEDYESKNGSINIQQNINIEDNHGTINM